MNKPSQERIERAARAMATGKHLGTRPLHEIAEAVLTADDSHLAAKLERVMKLLGEAEELLPFMAESKLELAITLLTKIRAEREGEV